MKSLFLFCAMLILPCCNYAATSIPGVPNRPELTEIKCTKHVAEVQWTSMGDGGSPITNYTIEYNTSFSPDSWEVAREAAVPGTDDEGTFYSGWKIQLSPWTNYSFRIIASNKIGPSHPSLPKGGCSTSADVPFKNPQSISVTSRGSFPDNKLIVSWTPMLESDQNGPEFRYVIQWKPVVTVTENKDSSNQEAGWNQAEIMGWKERNYTISNISFNKPFLIRVSARNGMGDANVLPTEAIGWSGPSGERFQEAVNFDFTKVLATTEVRGWTVCFVMLLTFLVLIFWTACTLMRKSGTETYATTPQRVCDWGAPGFRDSYQWGAP